MQLLCRNDITDFTQWKSVFDADAEDRSRAGLTLLQMWREHGNPNRVFVLFKVNDRDKARAFMDDPAARLHAEKSGLTDGACYFLDTA